MASQNMKTYVTLHMYGNIYLVVKKHFQLQEIFDTRNIFKGGHLLCI